MNGRTLGIIIVGSALGLGALMYWLQVYAFYRDVTAEEAGMSIVTAEGPRALDVADFRGINSDSSPIRFRACFTVEAPGALLADARLAEDAVPLNAPGWFDCFDAAGIGADLESGAATALLASENTPYGIDRIIALYPDGRAVAWDQINRCGAEVFDGNAPPLGCPLPPAL
ncbi:DUF6446 family protein [Ovoidimarina sediminis]|uniref:DUF6446 family protein n=1 Tax=Ovoidimarina sediminis TaxID=3079856 RepID=UPI00290936F8|nr:DUF6446 family protein [Rhodophyticola sp. MJ-SS7]MDU8943864.1 DUF6446 family protein [Rhodophyticola sp. MJ-SS7]